MSRILPILFNGVMVRAILEGRKTVTRRICKDANDFTVPDMGFYDANKRTYAVHNYADKKHTDKLSIAERTCPICPGDILYVRETWGVYTENWFDADYFLYCADYPRKEKKYMHSDGVHECDLPKWRPSIHMPKEAARIWLKVTDVRVERLQEITDEQAIMEGTTCVRYDVTTGQEESAALEWFSALWNSTIRKSDRARYGWNGNPWVWVIEFERCEKPDPCILEGKEPAEDQHPCIGYGTEFDDEPCEMCKQCKWCSGNDLDAVIRKEDVET